MQERMRKGHNALFPDTRPKQQSLTMVDEFGYVNVDKLCGENQRLGSSSADG